MKKSTKKLTKDEFIKKAEKVHGKKYDYSRSNYINTNTKLKIKCNAHGTFIQKAKNHLSGQGCPECGGSKKLTTKEFIKRSNKIHKKKYDYSLVEYKNSNTKVKIICTDHGLFEQLSYTHLSGSGCPNCCGNINLTTNEWIDKARIIHDSKYDYFLVEYKNNHTKVKITCLDHGIFEKNPSSHLSGQGCPKCGQISRIKKQTYTKEIFIEMSKEIHGDKYNYSLVEYKDYNTKVKIICPDHGLFEQNPCNHVNSKCGCQKCNSSKGELSIEKYFNKINEIYIKQHIFLDCRDKKPLKFDFYLPKHNVCVEFDGEQHFRPIKKWDKNGSKFDNII